MRTPSRLSLVERVAESAQTEPAHLEIVLADDLEPPFDPPDEADLEAPDWDESEDEFLIPSAGDEKHTHEIVAEVTDPAVADAALAPADSEQSEALAEPEPEAPEIALAEPVIQVEEDPPFDAPDEQDECFQPPLVEYELPPLNEAQPPARAELVLLPSDVTTMQSRPAHSFPRDPRGEDETAVRPLPAIRILICYDRTETGEMLRRASADPLWALAEIAIEAGGLNDAAKHAAEFAADLVVVESTFARQAFLEGVDALAPMIARGGKVVALGAVNDITLLRDLATRGVSQYIVPPFSEDEIVRGVCALYAEHDNSRVVAVIGARGGVGASTVARNIAWSIAERQQFSATLLDLDVAFGAAAFTAPAGAELSAADIVASPEKLAELPKDRALRFLTAAAKLEHAFEPNADAALEMLSNVRRTSPCVVLDVPHAWSPWVKQMLLAADDVIVVAAPDLASLRNAEQILRALRTSQPGIAPLVILSMVGMPKRPEIALKDFTETLSTAPIASFAFEPELFGGAEMAGRSLWEMAPRSKAATVIDTIATLITGRTPAESVIPVKRAKTAAKLGAPLTPAAATAEAEVALTQPPTLREAAPHFEGAPSGVPFTFRAEAAPIDLTSAAENAETKRSPPMRRGRRGLVRAIACALTLLLVGLWHVQNQRPAEAAAPERARPTALAAAPAPAISPESQSTAYEALRAAAEQGAVDAQYRLAKLYEAGDGVPADLSLAREWTERAASGGDTRAMHDLGVYYARGEGVERDDVAAFRWFRQAAEFGVLDSQFNLAVLYDEGRGVNQDGVEALFWFLVVGRAGDITAIQRANALEASLSPMQVDQAHARALAFSPRDASTQQIAQ